MPTDRLFRFSICGLIFLLSCSFFFYLFGLPTPAAVNDLSESSEQLLAVIAVFISSPILGVIVSTITIGIMFVFKGYRVYYYVPSDKEIVKNLLKGATPDESDFIINNIYDGKIRDAAKRLYPFYQSVVKVCIGGEALLFLERRWSTYWTHVNNLFSIGFALVITVAFKLSTGITECSFGAYKITGTILFTAYIISAYANLMHSRTDAVRVEHIWLERHLEQQAELEKQKAIKEPIIANLNSFSGLQLIIQGIRKLF